MEGVEPDALDDTVPDCEHGSQAVRPEVIEDPLQLIGNIDRLRPLECGHMVVERGARAHRAQDLLPDVQADGLLKLHRRCQFPMESDAACAACSLRNGRGILLSNLRDQVRVGLWCGFAYLFIGVRPCEVSLRPPALWGGTRDYSMLFVDQGRTASPPVRQIPTHRSD